ncbi:hypothetical protein [Terrabacter sp. MAHUQ-38]|uniref:hypothetical protein n=1 Tax=unclassified Terrabacter TaxID=2630222 RepID=UPI00165DB772|nr:hypothetical protein [Terrabacter sp. MAHUQ-38]MBC9820504.1 hypothetical protein [Terrabacter sp. MAHUQ-38]
MNIHDDGNAAAAQDEPSTTLVEVEDGWGLVFGPHPPEGVEIFDLELLPRASASAATDTVSRVLGAANVGGQALQGIAQMQGLVRLAPETMKMLQTAKPLTSGGVNLGTLVDANGKMAHSIRWMPAGASGATAVLASLGPAVALLAIQAQLAEISSLVRENIALTDEVLKAIRAEQWAQVQGLHETMLKGVDEARHIGKVSDHIWQNFAGHEAQLRTARRLFESKVDAHNRELLKLKKHEDRNEYLTHHAEAMLQDAQGLLQAQQAWFTYQALRAGHIYAVAGQDDTDSGLLLQKVADDARVERTRDLERAEELLTVLTVHLGIMAELPGDKTIPWTKGRRSAEHVAQAAKVLQDQTAKLLHGFAANERGIQKPAIVVADEGVPELLPRVLRWQLGKDERLLAYADAKIGQWWSWDEWKHVVVTDRRILVLDKSEFKKNGSILDAIKMEDLRYVRFDQTLMNARQPAKVEVVATSHSVGMELPDHSRKEALREEIVRFGQLVQSFMHLPSEEIPAPPILDEGTRTGLEIAGRADSRS